MDWAWNPGYGLRDKAVEDTFRGRAEVVAALRVPLNPENEVSIGSFGSLATFYCLNDTILWAAGGDTKPIAGDANCLMVAGIDGKAEKPLLLRGFFRCKDSAKRGIWCDGYAVGNRHSAPCGMIHRDRHQVLHKSSPTPDIQGLSAETDAEDGFVKTVCILKEKLIHILPGRIGGSTLRNSILAVLLRIDVGRASGEQNALTGIDQVGDLSGRCLKRNLDGFASTARDGSGILRAGTLVVGGIGAGWARNGDARLHSYIYDTANEPVALVRGRRLCSTWNIVVPQLLLSLMLKVGSRD